MATSAPAKRKDRPCDACRKRKSRCVLEEGSTICVLCKFHGQECTFLHEPQVRKRKVPQDGDDPTSKRRLSSSSSRSKKSPRPQARIIRTTSGTGVEEYDELDEPTLLKKTLGLQNKHHSQYIGATRGLEPALLGSLLYKEKGEIPLSHGTLRRVNSREAFLVLPDPETQGYSDELDDLDAIEAIIRPHGKALVDLYFRIVFPSFPILHKEVYLEKYARSYREFSPPLLAAVYLLALQYWTYDDKLSSHTKPDVETLEKLARKGLRDTIHRPKLSTVQAGLLLLQHADTDSAELTAQLVSVGYGLGLHLNASDWNIPDWEKGLRKRLGWGLYMQDKWSSLGSGRPSLINSSNWGLQDVTSNDFPENASHEDDQEGSSEVEKGRILFSHMILLSQILADLLDAVFTLKTSREIAAAGPNGLAIILEKAKPVQLRLKEWFTNLPECLSMDSTQVMKLSSIGYLRLAYVATEITLHRRIILALTPSTDPQLLRICRSVAHERFMFAMDFIQSLKPQHLSSFWYFASSHNFALIGVFGTLLCWTALNQEEADFYHTKLREYRWILKMNSENGAKYMRPSVALLDANMALLKEIKDKVEVKTEVIPSTTIGYASLSSHPATASVAIVSPDYAFTNSQMVGGAEFSSPAQYSYDALYYPGNNPVTTPSTYTTSSASDGPHDFSFGAGADSRLWNY